MMQARQIGGTSVHASAVQVGDRAVLIRGPSGAGKSRLAFELIMAGRSGTLPRAILVGDDRLHLEVEQGQIVVSPVRQLAGLIEIYGLGIRRCDFVARSIVGLVVDLAAMDAERLPAPEALETQISGVILPRIPVGQGQMALPLVVAGLTTTSGKLDAIPDDCPKGIGNHIRHSIATD